MTQEGLSPQEFIDSYGLDAIVQVGKGTEMSLGQALELEKMFCPADKDVREDPARRLGYLANILAAAGTLKPEDEHLLSRPE